MPIEAREIDGGLGSVVCAEGVLTDEEFIDCYTEFFAQPEDKLRAYRYNFSDYGAVMRLDLSTHAVRRMAELAKGVSSINAESVIAILAPKAEVFGMARMWETLKSETHWESMVFKEREDALGWLKHRVKEKYGIDRIEIP